MTPEQILLHLEAQNRELLDLKRAIAAAIERYQAATGRLVDEVEVKSSAPVVRVSICTDAMDAGAFRAYLGVLGERDQKKGGL